MDLKRIAIDAMGGDNAPFEVVKGVVEASKSVKYKLALVGKEEVIWNDLKNINMMKARLKL